MSDTFNAFFPLQKVVEQPDGTCLVYSRGTQEVRDAVDEVFDYDSSVPLIRQWSDDVFKTSGGKSYGNVRAMHGKQAAGKLFEPIGYRDAEKAVDLVVKVVDPVDVKKCKEGVYTGMSLGGKYANRWFDPSIGLYRYTAKPEEWSLVDRPAVPTATFQMVKLDGKSELCKFVGAVELDANAVEPRKDDEPQGIADMALQQPSDPVIVEKPNVPAQPDLSTEMPIVGDVPVAPDPLSANAKEIAIPAQVAPPVDMQKATELMNAIASRMDQFVQATENAAAMRKADEEKQTKAIELLKAKGAKVGIARRAGEPWAAPQGLPVDLNAYGDPANYAVPLDTMAQCTAAIAKFNDGESKAKYNERERHVLGQRIAHKATTLTSVNWRYDARAKVIKVEGKMANEVKKDAASSIAGDLRAVAQNALDNINDPQAVMAALHQILAGIDVAADVDTSTPPVSSGASTLEAAAGTTASTPSTPVTTGTTGTGTTATTGTPASSSSSEEMKTVMAKVDAIADAQKNLSDTFAKFLDALKPTPQPAQKSVTIGDLNALVETGGNATSLEKALVDAALTMPDGIQSDSMLNVMKAAGGDPQLASDTALALVRKSFVARGISAAEKVRMVG